MTFAELQALFQRAIVEGDDAVLGLIPNGSRETREVLLGVYRNAYVMRLVEIMQSDHERLHSYLGDQQFEAMARAYVAAHPSDRPNARWFSRHLPEFLARTAPYSSHPEVAELALLEKTLADAFDAKDGPSLAIAELAAIAPEAWAGLVFDPHPAAMRLEFSTNAAAIWLALGDDEPPPSALRHGSPEQILVWRNGPTPLFRILGGEEAMMWDEAARGVPFGALCEMVAIFDDAETAPMRAAGYLQGWITGGAIATASLGAGKRRSRERSRRQRRAA